MRSLKKWRIQQKNKKQWKSNGGSNKKYISKTTKLTFPRLQIQSSNNNNNNNNNKKVNTVSPLTIVILIQ